MLCLEYVAQDVKTTADVYRAILEQGIVEKWITHKGTVSRAFWRPETKDGRLLTVDESLALKAPDTSWMTFQGPTRESCAGWLKT